jgi:hypothetical protein
MDNLPIANETELLGFPAGLLSDLPEPMLLRLHVAGAPVPVYLATYPLALDPPVLADRVMFDRSELRALLQGVEADRIWHADFLGYCFEKWRSPGFHLSAEDALSGVNTVNTVNSVDAEGEARGWTLARVLRRLQAQLISVELLSDGDSCSEKPRSHTREFPRQSEHRTRLPAAA